MLQDLAVESNFRLQHQIGKYWAGYVVDTKCKIATPNAKSQSGIALKSTIDPSSSFTSLKLIETCQISRVFTIKYA